MEDFTITSPEMLQLDQTYCIIFGDSKQSENLFAVIFIPKERKMIMWVEETKQGKYKYIERFTDPLTGKYRRVSIVLDKNTRQAQKQAQAALQERIQDAMEPQKNNITLEKLIKLYREEQARTVKQSTYQRNYFACETLKRILGADIKMDSLNAGYIRKKMIATGKDPGTLNEHLIRLKSLIRWGYRNDYVSDISYLEKLERFKDIPHSQKIEGKFLESDEASRLIESMKMTKWKHLTEFLLLSGLRFGEAAALSRKDIDFKNRVIHVCKNYDSVNDIVTTPKTRTSVRDVYMQDELYRLCKTIAARSLSRSVIEINSVNLFFPGNDGKHIQFYAYNKYLKENAMKVIGREITPHTLRHTHASLMMEKGMSEEAISRRLGHTDSRITKQIYLHVTQKMKVTENEQIKNIKLF